MDIRKFMRNVLDAEKLKLAKLGWTEAKRDKEILSYVRGYIWRTFGIRIKEPIDWIILFMINEALSHDMKVKELQNTIVRCVVLDCPLNTSGLCKSHKIKIEPIFCEHRGY